jgi:cytochrome P450
MQLLNDLGLPHVPVNTPEFDRNPLPYIEAARRQHPWLAKINEGYFVHGYQAIKDFSIMDDKLAPSFDGIVEIYGAQGTEWGRWMQEHVIAISGPRHVRIRNSIAHAFTPGVINRFRPMMRARIGELLDVWAPKGKFDFAEFISHYPISVLCGILGTSAADIPGIRHALETQGRVISMDRALLPELIAGHEVMWNYVNNLVIEREKAGPTGDPTPLDQLIEAKNAGKINDQELRDLLLVLFPAGYDTSKSSLTLTMHTLLKHPAYWERCAADHEFCGKVVEEMFRYGSVAAAFRKVKVEFVYDEVQLPEGTLLFFGNPLCGHDPRAFTDADEFQPERVSTNRHVAFGRGAHMCIGQHLARAQITEGLHMIAQRITKPRPAGDVVWRTYLGTWGPDSLPIEFEPAPARAPSLKEAG